MASCIHTTFTAKNLIIQIAIIATGNFITRNSSTTKVGVKAFFLTPLHFSDHWLKKLERLLLT